MFKPLNILFISLVLISCSNPSKNEEVTTSEIKDTIKKEVTEKIENTNDKNKVEVDFEKNKTLLDIILLLPNECFSSWDWKLEDRKKWYNEIKTNNYYIDNDPQFFSQKYLEPY